MDDTYFCEKSPQYVQALLPELERRLSLLGLKINPKKTQVISNRRDDSTTFIIGGVRVQPGGPRAIMTVLGAPISPWTVTLPCSWRRCKVAPAEPSMPIAVCSAPGPHLSKD